MTKIQNNKNAYINRSMIANPSLLNRDSDSSSMVSEKDNDVLFDEYLTKDWYLVRRRK